VDERLATYVEVAWSDLVDYAQDLRGRAGDPDLVGAEEIVLATLSTVASRWWFAPDRDHPDAYVRQKLVVAATKDVKRQERGEAFQLMEIEGAGIVKPDAHRYTAAAALAIVVRRARRVSQIRIGGVVVAASVVLALGVPALTHSQPEPRLRATTRPVPVVPAEAFAAQPNEFVTGVAAGAGTIWTVASRTSASGSVAVVDERDPVSGHLLAQFVAPEAADHIAFGLGQVWVWHDEADFPAAGYQTVNQGHVVKLAHPPPVAPQDVAFTGRTAWFTTRVVHSAVALPRGMVHESIRLRSALGRTVVRATPTSVMVTGGNGTLRERPGDGIVDPGFAAPTSLVAAPGYGIWLVYGRYLAYQSSVNSLITVGLTMPLTVRAVVGDPTHGVYVATRSDGRRAGDGSLVYYSPAALRMPNPHPTARFDGTLNVEGMAADPAGGVVVVTSDGAVEWWNPAG
jgi:hypothetical protein